MFINRQRRRRISDRQCCQLAVGVVSQTFESRQMLSGTGPRLLVDAADFAELRARATVEPWKTKYESSKSYAENNYEAGEAMHTLRATRVSNIFSLMAVFEEDAATRQQYAGRVMEVLDWWPTVAATLNSNSHSSWVGPSGALMSSIVAMDMYWDDFSAADQSRAVSNVETIMEVYNTSTSFWPLADYGLAAVWAIFTSDPEVSQYIATPDATPVQTHIERYVDRMLDYSISEDGAWQNAPGYFDARLVERLAKTAPLDILTHTGNYDFYNDAQMQKAFEWYAIFGRNAAGALMPFGETLNIGWSSTSSHDQNGAYYRMTNYGETAAGYAAWHYQQADSAGPQSDPSIQSRFFEYVLYDPTNLTTPVAPPSTAVDSYGVAFRQTLHEASDSNEALDAVLYSQSDSSTDFFGHGQWQTNSFTISGYGQFLLSNSGAEYTTADGSSFRYPGHTPEDINWGEARYQNVVLIGDDANHVAHSGGGLEAALLAEDLQYARASSGNAIKGGHHSRGMIFVPPEDGVTHGYYILLDEVEVDSSDDTVKVLLQPNTLASGDGLRTVAEDTHYVADIDALRIHNDANDGGEKVSIFYATPPQEVKVESSFKTGWGDDDQNDIHETVRLVADYQPGADQVARSVTVLFPQDPNHSAATITRLSGTGFTGAMIDHGSNVVDRVYESNGSVAHTTPGGSFQGKEFFYRANGQNIASYFLHGTSFAPADDTALPFSADAPVSVQMNGLQGGIDSAGTQVRFVLPRSGTVLVNGTEPDDVAQATVADGVEVAFTIPGGRHSVEIQLDSLLDLLPVSFNAVADHILLGQTDVEFTVRNTGVGDVGAFETQIIWSPNDVFGDADDVPLPNTVVAFAGLAEGESATRTVTATIRRVLLNAQASVQTPVGESSGFRSAETSYLFLDVDHTNAVTEANEHNNSGNGLAIDADDITYFPWDVDGNGTVTPREALRAIAATGTSFGLFDFDGNGIVTPMDVLAVIQRIGYRRNEDVVEQQTFHQQIQPAFPALLRGARIAEVWPASQLRALTSLFKHEETEFRAVNETIEDVQVEGMEPFERTDWLDVL